MATESATEDENHGAAAAREPEDPSACDVLILGASMAGIDVLYHLRRRGAVGRRLRVIVVDRQPAHGYIPLVQERLCARIDRASSALETQTIIDGDPHARFVLGEVESFDPERRAVTLRGGQELRGTYVVVALGSVVTPPPGLPGRERALGYKFTDGFERSTARLEQALRGDGPAGQDAPRFVVVGGGISGVELAGDLAHLAARRPDGWRVPQVTLVQGADRLLPGMTRRAGTLAARHLKRQGVELRLGARVVAIREGEVVIRPKGAGRGESASGPYREGERAGEQTLTCAGVFWAGGVRPAPALQRLNLPLTDDGWLQVGPTLQCFPEARPRLPEIFACGDAARIVGGDASAWPTMQRAIECLWQADLVARNILRLEAYKPDGEGSYPPPLTPHTLREDFFHGVSMGARSMIVYGRLAIELGAWAVWFRRFLMRQYFRRYRGLRRA